MHRPLLAAAAALLCPAAAHAVPPPVSIAPTLVTPADDGRLATEMAELLQTLSGSHYALLPAQIEREALIGCGFEKPNACAAAAIAGRLGVRTPAVALFVDHPGWRSAAVRVRCVGAGSARAREIRLHVRDALRGTLDGDRAERSAFASCLIGSLYGPERKPEDF